VIHFFVKIEKSLEGDAKWLKQPFHSYPQDYLDNSWQLFAGDISGNGGSLNEAVSGVFKWRLRRCHH